MTSPHAPAQLPHLLWAVEHNRRALVPIAVMVIMTIVAMLLLGLTVLQAGAAASLGSAILALVPVIPLAALFLWVDRWEPEPGRMLLAAFLWGTSMAVLIALVSGTVLNITWEAILSDLGAYAFSLAVTAPITEEICKGLFLVWLFTFRRREIDGIVDGIVYAGLVGLGFAFTENIFYLSGALSTEGIEGGVVTFVLRCVISPFAHPLFTIMLGIGLGLAVQSARREVKYTAPIIGLLGAMLLHSLWNGSTLLLGGYGFMLVYLFIMLPALLATIVLVIWQRRRLQRVVAQQLPAMVEANLITADETPHLACLTGRRDWRATVRQRHGREAADAVREYHAVVTELAILYDRIQRGAIGSYRARYEPELVHGLRAARHRVISQPIALRTAAGAVPRGNPYYR
ncbi:PrsW family intramembrane metalloprotease [Lolliginicoccus suaedae]|uniref:PrsW family intramembrane metalloprotease n=1 Tax=Lolliginicoccus suaedae TaxID=2605429 RepID=UPI001CA8CB3A|nr:PrsW family intramembrane metalloprotease [Lolliginicoccus suaedae]